MTSVAIVGAGLLGSTVANELAGAGAGVTVLEAGRPAGGTSGSSFAWVNAQDKSLADYYELNAEGVAAYPALVTSLGGDDLPGGDIAIGAERARRSWPTRSNVTWRSAIRYGSWTAPQSSPWSRGSSCRPMASSVRPTFPTRPGSTPRCSSSAVLPGRPGSGANVRVASAVTGFSRAGDRVTGVLTEAGPVAADVVLVAAGTASEELAGLAGAKLPMSPSPGVSGDDRSQPT